mmetsp:Transcript_12634/g.21742  ORF Transcript_12634/g.21742 Transcript_12634/m.21742 type:complete len:83 (-) Transcript_12634:1274-1522(-)
MSKRANETAQRKGWVWLYLTMQIVLSFSCATKIYHSATIADLKGQSSHGGGKEHGHTKVGGTRRGVAAASIISGGGSGGDSG